MMPTLILISSSWGWFDFSFPLSRIEIFCLFYLNFIYLHHSHRAMRDGDELQDRVVETLGFCTFFEGQPWLQCQTPHRFLFKTTLADVCRGDGSVLAWCWLVRGQTHPSPVSFVALNHGVGQKDINTNNVLFGFFVCYHFIFILHICHNKVSDLMFQMFSLWPRWMCVYQSVTKKWGFYVFQSNWTIYWHVCQNIPSWNPIVLPLFAWRKLSSKLCCDYFPAINCCMCCILTPWISFLFIFRGRPDPQEGFSRI